MTRIALRRLPLWLACGVWMAAYVVVVGVGLSVAALIMTLAG